MTHQDHHPIRVGVIGASPLAAGWATAAHIPAIQASEHFELAAVSTSRVESARAAEATFGVPAHVDAGELISRGDVDLVVVAVKAPLHFDLIREALEAGKLVLSEWPLGANLEEARRLAAMADAAGTRTFVGLQARFSPVLERARRLIEEGFIGEVLATNLSGSAMAWTGETDPAHAYVYDRSSGANVLSVPLMHALDAMRTVLGPVHDLTGRAAVRRKDIIVRGAAELLHATAPDHIALAGRLSNGAIASIAYRGGAARTGNLRWEINGTDGDLLVTADNGNIQVADLHLAGGRGDDDVVGVIKLDVTDGISGMGGNVRRLYAAIANDLVTDSRAVADFAEALAVHEELSRIESTTGL